MNPPLRSALVAVLIAFAVLCVITFLPAPASEYERAARYFTQAEIETGERFAFERRLLTWASVFVELGLLIALVATGASRRLADRFSRWTGWSASPVNTDENESGWRRLMRWTSSLSRWLATLALMAAVYFALHELLQLPWSVAHFYQNGAWGMTKRPFIEWLGEHFLALGVTIVIEAGVGLGLYMLFRVFPRTWYIWGTLGATGLAFAFAWLQPVVIAPLFNTFTPLSETPWADLEKPIRYLTDKAGISVDQVYVADASRQGNHTNAYFTGMGATQSIVLYDTLLEKHPPAEVESILAHEIGHWVHRHIINGILLGALAALVGLIVLDRIMRWFIGRPPLYLTGLTDSAGLPLVLLLGYLGSWVAMPLENLVSRHFERQADTMSLTLAGMPDVFIEAEKRLARENKSNVVPAPWNVWLFSTHPPAIARIEMAEHWKK